MRERNEKKMNCQFHWNRKELFFCCFADQNALELILFCFKSLLFSYNIASTLCLSHFILPKQFILIQKIGEEKEFSEICKNEIQIGILICTIF